MQGDHFSYLTAVSSSSTMGWSGSTGAPRGVWFSAEQLQADVDQIVPTMGLRREWPNVGVISLAHSYGFSNLVLPLLLHGIPLILGANALPGTVERLLEVHGPVTLPAVPAMWRAWLGCEDVLPSPKFHS